MVKLIKICPVIPRDQSVFILSSFSDEFFDFLKIPHKNRFLLYENFVGE